MSKIYNSLQEAMTVFAAQNGFKLETKPAREERGRKCKICGADMEHKLGTNIYICHGEIPVIEDGKEVFVMDADGNIAVDEQGNQIHKTEPCTNFAIGKV